MEACLSFTITSRHLDEEDYYHLRSLIISSINEGQRDGLLYESMVGANGEAGGIMLSFRSLFEDSEELVRLLSDIKEIGLHDSNLFGIINYLASKAREMEGVYRSFSQSSMSELMKIIFEDNTDAPEIASFKVYDW